MKAVAIVVGAGESRRFAHAIPKQYCKLDGISIFQFTIKSFCEFEEVEAVLPVINEKLVEMHKREVSYSHAKLLNPVIGGKTRQESVYNALHSLKGYDVVLVHDACRPFVKKELIKKGMKIIETSHCAVPILPLSDSLLHEGKEYMAKHYGNAHRIQTPQFFSFSKLLKAHQSADGTQFADDASLLKNSQIKTFPGEVENIKITYQHDLIHAKTMSMHRSLKVGHGIDFHQLKEGIPLIICGVKIPYSKGLLGHSDGDVGLHSIVDAILGACSAEDIGSHFSSKDDRWKGANSKLFLEHAIAIMKEKNGVISHIDLTIICQEPMISPYKEQMRSVISKITDVRREAVNIKATTTDHMGFLGRGEGICAMSVVTVTFP